VEEVQIMEELPHYLRRDIAYYVNRKIFSRLQLFHDFPKDLLVTISSLMVPLQVEPSLFPGRVSSLHANPCFMQCL
jgi:hypothetical protein